MSKTHFRKILSDIRLHRSRTLLVVLSIMIGVFGVTALVGMGDLLVGQLNSDLDQNKIAMTHVYVVSSGGQMSLEDNQALIDELSTLPGVERVEGQAIYPMDWHRADAEDFEAGSVIAFSQPFEQVQLEPISRVVEGRYPVSGQNEIAVEQRFADTHDMAVGDKIVFRGSEATAWEIVGIVFQPYPTMTPHSSGIAIRDPATPPETNIYATYEDAQQIVGFPGLSSFLARYNTVEAAHDGLSDFVGVMTANSPYITAFSFIDDPAENSLVKLAATFTNIMNILAVVAMIVSAFLVVNVINTIVVEQKRQIGVMKSLGATRLDTLLIYSGQALAYGVLGSIVGVIIAVPTASWMSKAIAPFVSTYMDGFQVSTVGVITGFGLGLLIPVLASLMPVLNGTRVSILEAMTDMGIASQWGTSRLSRFIGGLPLPTTVRQALSNIIQKRGRLALTILTLTMALGAFMGVTALFTTLDDAVNRMFATYDNEIQMTTQEAEDPAQVRQMLLENFDHITHVTPAYNVSVELEGYTGSQSRFSASTGNQVSAVGVDPTAGVVNFRLSSGTGWQDDPTRKGVILNESVAKTIGKKTGDTVVITVGGQAHEYEVIGVDQWPFDTLFFEWSELARIAGYTNAQGEPTPGAFNIDLEGDPTAEEVEAVIEEIKTVAATNGIQAVYTNQPQNEADLTQMITSFRMVFNLTAVVMALVGAIGLLATLSMAVLERQKEIGVMRSLGAGSSTIILQFLVEGILVAVIAWLFGLPLSYLVGYAIHAAVDLESFFRFEYPILVALQGLIGIIVLTAIASAWPSIAAARKTVSDILRYQ